MQTAIIIAAVIVGVALLLLISISSIWRKVPPDKAVVITGVRKPRVITAGGTMVIPMFERTDVISLENMKLEVRIDGALTEQGVEIYVDGVSVVKVKSDAQSILMAMEQFNTGREQQTIETITTTVRDVLEGKLREIISKLTVEEIYKDREKFASEVEGVASVALADMGLELKIFTIRDINDKNQYLESLGKKQIAQVKKDAAIAQAEATRETVIRTAEAQRLSQEAQLVAETQVAEASKAKALRVEAFRREQEIARAVADNAYAIQENMTRQEVTETEMNVELLKKQRMTQLAQEEANRRERELDSTIRKQADAELYRRQREAEAEKFAQIQRAQSEAEQMKLEGDARATAARAEGTAQAEIIRNRGMAEVEIIRERGIAEADAMMRKAEAYRQYNEAAVLQMIIERLPEIAQNIAAPLARTEKIVMIGDGGGSKMTKDITNMLAQLPEVTEALTGINLADLIQNFVGKSAAPVANGEIVHEPSAAVVETPAEG